MGIPPVFHSAANNRERGHVSTGQAEMRKVALSIQTLKVKYKRVNKNILKLGIHLHINVFHTNFSWQDHVVFYNTMCIYQLSVQ